LGAEGRRLGDDQRPTRLTTGKSSRGRAACREGQADGRSQWRLPLGVVPGEVLSVVVVVEEGGERGFRLGGRSARDFGVARAREATS
jgi:hypothetical protein